MNRSTLSLATFTFSLLTASPAFPAIKGTVMSTAGLPLPNASIVAHAPESSEARMQRLTRSERARPSIASANTDARGKFTLDVKKEPVVELMIDAEGYAPVAIVLAADDDAGAIPLQPAVMLTGTVTAGGKPVAGAVLIWSGADRTEKIQVTGDDGKYMVPDPKLWAVSRRVMASGFAASVESFGPQSKPQLDAVLGTGSMLAGKLTTAANTEAPAPQFLVDGWPAAAKLGDEGKFELSHLPKNWQEIRVLSGSRAGRFISGARTPATIRLDKPSSLAGSVRDSVSQKPLAGASLVISAAGGLGGLNPNTASYRAIADSGGKYTLPSLPSGSYSVNLSMPNYVTARSEVELKPGENVTRNLSALRAATVSGSIIDSGRKALAAARLLSINTGAQPFFPLNRFGGLRASSAPDGSFVLRNVSPEVELEIVASVRGLPEARSAAMKLTSGEKKSGLVITIPAGLKLSGLVTDTKGNPIANARVFTSATPQDAPGMVRLGNLPVNDEDALFTGRDGKFSAQLKEGQYELLVRAEGFAPNRVRGLRLTAETEPLKIILVPGVEITGRVVRKSGEGVAEVTIVTSSGQGEQVRTAADGSFVLTGLAEGQTMVIAIRPEEFIREMRTVSAPKRDLIIELPAGGTIRGRVVDKSSKKPVTDFRIGTGEVRAGGGGMMMRMPATYRSVHSDDGSFLLENVPLKSSELTVQAPGFAEGKLSGFTLEEGKVLENLEIALEPGSTLTGRITSSEGTAIAGASIRMERAGDDSPMPQFAEKRTTTDSNGDYKLESLPSGELSIVFDKAGFQTERKTARLSGRELRLDVRLSRGRDFSGTVTTEAGAPVADATVHAQSAAVDAQRRSARSDTNGNFKFEGLTPGRYQFEAAKAGYVSGEAKDVDIQSAGSSVRLTLTSGGTITGRVTGLAANDLPATTISVVSAGKRSSGAVDPSGSFQIEGVAPGTARVSATSQQIMGDRKTSREKTITVAAGAVVQTDIEFNSDIVIKGRVTRNGKAAVNTMVSFSPALRTAGQASPSTRTDSEGRYEITGVETGKYRVMAVDLGSFDPYSTEYTVVGSATFDIDIRGASVRGRVLDAQTSEPLAGASVSLEPADSTEPSFFNTRTAATDANGAFSLESVPAGRYKARASLTKYGQKIIDLTVSETGTPDLILKLSANDGLSMRVFDARDGRALNALLRATDMQGRVAYQGGSRNQADGVTRLPLSPGTYRITVSADGYATSTFTVTSPSELVKLGVTPGGSVNILSTRPSRERARMLSSSGEPYLMAIYGGMPGELTVDPGSTRLPHVAPGTYVLELLNLDGSVRKRVPVVVAEGQASTVNVE